MSFSGNDITAMPKVSNYLGLIVKFSLAFGLAFQIPILVVVLVRIGILQLDSLRRGRRYAFLVCAIAAAILSPPDVLSMVLLMIPMYLLFELGLLFSTYFERKAARTATNSVDDPEQAMNEAEKSFRDEED